MKIHKILLTWALSFFVITPQIQAQLTKRADYSITIPVGSKLDPADAEIDLDHLTTINLPDGNTLTITVVDEVDNTEAVYKQTIATFEKLVGGKAEKSNLFDVISGEGVSVQGKVNGIQIIMIVGCKKGEKGFIFGSSYFQTESKTSRELLHQIIKSFKEM